MNAVEITDLPSDTNQSIASLGSETSDFESAHGEPLAKVLDLDTWMLGENLLSVYGRLEQEVADAAVLRGLHHHSRHVDAQR